MRLIDADKLKNSYGWSEGNDLFYTEDDDFMDLVDKVK